MSEEPYNEGLLSTFTKAYVYFAFHSGSTQHGFTCLKSMSAATALKIQGVRKPKLMTMYKIRTKELGAFFKALNLLVGSPVWTHLELSPVRY